MAKLVSSKTESRRFAETAHGDDMRIGGLAGSNLDGTCPGEPSITLHVEGHERTFRVVANTADDFRQLRRVAASLTKYLDRIEAARERAEVTRERCNGCGGTGVSDVSLPPSDGLCCPAGAEHICCPACLGTGRAEVRA